MREYSREMNLKALEAKERAMYEAQAVAMSGQPAPQQPSNVINNLPPDMPSTDSTSPTARRGDAAVDEEDGKRNLITSEIQMFRDRFKDEETKMRNTEKERKERYERERVLQREKRLAEETGKNKSGTSPSSPSSHDRSSPRRDHHSSSNSNRRDRSSPSDDRYRSSSSRNNTSNSVRSRNNDRRSSPSSSRYDRRSPVSSASRSYNRRSRTKSPVSKSHGINEDDDEAYERKRQERRLREKEHHYREVDCVTSRKEFNRSFCFFV